MLANVTCKHDGMLACVYICIHTAGNGAMEGTSMLDSVIDTVTAALVQSSP